MTYQTHYWHDNHGRKDEHLPIGEGMIAHEKTVSAKNLIRLILNPMD